MWYCKIRLTRYFAPSSMGSILHCIWITCTKKNMEMWKWTTSTATVESQVPVGHRNIEDSVRINHCTLKKTLLAVVISYQTHIRMILCDMSPLCVFVRKMQHRDTQKDARTRRVSSSAGSGVGDLTKGTTMGDLTASCWGCWGQGSPNAVIG